ncbi:hypothetical protein [Azospira restricta]|uniref:V-type ATP synthase subunit I n=1 Tax=Azospira restricta TaxID=404405 RepID=A0A974SMA2_9RHOO|nr:hypothetical protein [Azospira restricta]QRJ62257.1 hypothetical protein IWH25_10655 [Azospira restricta]
MTLRPECARWFEILAAREDALGVADALAAAGCAEFEAGSVAVAGADGERHRRRERFRELERRYREWWPEVAPAVPQAFPDEALAAAIARVDGWAAAAAPTIAALVAAEAELAELAQWREILAAPEFGAGERAALAGASRLSPALFACPEATPPAPEGLLLRPFAAGGRRYLFALGEAPAMALLAEQLAAAGGRRLSAPAWLGDAEAPARLAARAEACRQAAVAARARLAGLADQHGLAAALAAARCCCWGVDNVAALEERRALCRVTGWTGDPAGVRGALAAAGLAALVRFPPPPAALQPPLLLHNPWWASPYERFCRLLGMPAGNAADPSALVALIFPLLFGYMFGDLGQGLVVCAAGIAFGGRWPLARLLVPAGLAAALFGLLFGSVFSQGGIIAPLWTDPLADPLPVLLPPIAAGAALLLLSVALAGVEARWRGELAAFVRREGGAVVLYLALLAAFAVPADYVVPLLAAALLAQLPFAARGGALGLLAGLAECLEKTLQLLINTVSFVRVGAFAIAHAGLSAALAMLADAAGGGVGWLLVVVLGNLFIVALEVLVVSIQTTRLVLFEFFTRFFVGSGRAFHPQAPAGASHDAASREVRHEN